MELYQILIPVTLVAIGIADIRFRKELAGLVVASMKGGEDAGWAATLETVQLVSGGGFILVGLGLAATFLLL